MCKSMVTIKHVKLENPLVARESILLMQDVVKLSHCIFTVRKKDFKRKTNVIFFIDKTEIVKLLLLKNNHGFITSI